MSKIFITSDTHFGHYNIINLCKRPFSSSLEMDNKLIENINSVVGPDDHLYHLGDFSFRGRDPIHYRKQINCKNIYLIRGNHDNKEVLNAGFAWVKDYFELKLNNFTFVLFHYPIFQWNKKHYGTIHLHGHCHGNLGYQGNGINSWDVGVDCGGINGYNKYVPYSLDFFTNGVSK